MRVDQRWVDAKGVGTGGQVRFARHASRFRVWLTSQPLPSSSKELGHTIKLKRRMSGCARIQHLDRLNDLTGPVA